jgi:hypothetical protein
VLSVAGSKSFRTASDGRLKHNAEEVGIDCFAAQWGYILKQRHTRDLPATTTIITEQTHAADDESRGVRWQHSKLGWWILAGLWTLASRSLESWPAAANHTQVSTAREGLSGAAQKLPSIGRVHNAGSARRTGDSTILQAEALMVGATYSVYTAN